MKAEVTIVSKIENPLLERTELTLFISHLNNATPKRSDISQELSSKYKVPTKQIYVHNIKTGFGVNKSYADVHLYKSFDVMKDIVHPYVINKITGESKERPNRKARKEAKKERRNRFGTVKRNLKKIERRESKQQ